MAVMPSSVPTREAILACLREADTPLTAQELGDRLSVSEVALEVLGKRLAAMERDGQLLPNRKGVLLLASKLDFVAGRVSGHRDGFGFLIPDDGGPDIFLTPREMQKAMHGDRVLVKRTGFDRRGKPEGTIVEVTERANRRLVGRLLSERGITVVVPEDQRIKHDILIPPGEPTIAQPGQVVTVEILEQPSGYTQPIGRIVEVLGEIDDPGMEIEIAVRKFDVPHQFPAEVLTLAETLPDSVRPADLRDRVDLRDVPLVTIDGEDARDFDDAVYCEPCEVGTGKSRRKAGWRLLVAIADVSHYVRPGDALDCEALARSTSVYFPRRVIPMLPEKLSNGLCSLNPQVERLVLVCDMVIDGDGVCRAYQFYEAVMHSAARLTYDEVWNILSGRDAQASRRRAELVPHLNHLYALYRVLSKARIGRGAIDFDTVETKIVVDPAGRIEKIVPRTRNDAHKLIEECMLAANVSAADFVHRGKHPCLYRVHEGPTPEKLATLREFLRNLGLSLGVSAEPEPGDYARLTEKIRDRPDAALLQTMLLRSMQQAIYSPDNAGHFGLAYEAYAHFTSPIRRYPDLVTHRAIKALIRGERHEPFIAQDSDAWLPMPRGRRSAMAKPAPATPEAAGSGSALKARREAVSVDAPGSAARPERPAVTDRWQRLGLICSANERRADDASRDVEAWLKSQYMRNHVGEQFSGRITGVATFGVFVTLDALYVEGLVHVSELGTDYFQYSETSHELRGERTGVRFRLTDPIEVQVARVDLEARRIEFRLVPKRETARAVVEAAASRSAREAGGSAPLDGSAARPSKRVIKAVKGKPAAVAKVQAERRVAAAGERQARRNARRTK